MEWIQVLERLFGIKEYSDKKAFKVVVLKLKNYASLWYENFKKRRAREGKPRDVYLAKLTTKHTVLEELK